MEGGFREDESADFGDLLKSSSTAFGASSTYSAFGGPQDDDDLAANPFADLASSSAQLPYEPQERAQSPFYSAPVASPPVQPAYDESPYVPPAQPVFTPTEEAPASSYEPTPSAYDPAAYETVAYEPQPAAYEPQTSNFEPSTPVTFPNTLPDRHFHREAAPEPETPAQPQLQPGDPDGFSYTYSRPSPSTSRFQSASSPTTTAPPEAESPFASQSTRRGKADLSALLGAEKPTAMSGFRKAERAEGSAGPLGSKIAVLPAKSVGKKPVARPLAALLGLETEEEEPTKVKASAKPAAEKEGTTKEAAAQGVAAKDSAVEGAAPASASEPAPQASDPTEPPAPVDPAPLPPVELAVEPPVPSALETPLPPSRAQTPPQPEPTTAAADADAGTDEKPSLERAVSAAPSTMSADAPHDPPYDAMVSPLETGATLGSDGAATGGEAWPGNKAVDGLDEQLAALKVAEPATQEPSPEADTTPAPASASYSQYIFGGEGASTAGDSESTSGPPSAETPPSRGFRAFNGSSEDGGFGATDDADSLRGTYSRSVEVGDGEDADTETGASTPATEKTVAVGDQQRSQREVRSGLVLQLESLGLTPSIDRVPRRFRPCLLNCRRFRARRAALSSAAPSARRSSSRWATRRRSAARSTPPHNTPSTPSALE